MNMKSPLGRKMGRCALLVSDPYSQASALHVSAAATQARAAVSSDKADDF